MANKAAERARRFRQRQNRGIAVWRIEVDESALAAALIEAGLVDPNTATQSDYQAAAANVLSEFYRNNSVTRYGQWLARRGKSRA